MCPLANLLCRCHHRQSPVLTLAGANTFTARCTLRVWHTPCLSWPHPTLRKPLEFLLSPLSPSATKKPLIPRFLSSFPFLPFLFITLDTHYLTTWFDFDQFCIIILSVYTYTPLYLQLATSVWIFLDASYFLITANSPWFILPTGFLHCHIALDRICFVFFPGFFLVCTYHVDSTHIR